VSRAALLALAALAAACNPTSEDNFLSGRGLSPCNQVIPACPGLWASCVLDVDNYARTTFPGAMRFMTRADPEVEIEVAMYLMDQRDAGVSTQIYWNEPSCSDVYTYDSGGANLFEDATDHVLRKRMKVHQGGDHLIEIITDMQSVTDVTIDLIEPGS
jgi:hypothetical protein